MESKIKVMKPIRATELRIGNYATKYSRGKTEIVKVNVYTISEVSEGSLRLEPIELTEQVLLKCGFVNGKDLNWGNPVIDIDGISWMGSSFDGHIFFNQIKPPCKYLHQLQNLYFALTGKELEFKA